MDKSDVKEVIVEMAENAYAMGKISLPEYQKILEGCGRTLKPEISAEEFVAIRKKCHLSQAALGLKIGASVAAITKWETGKQKVQGPVAVLMKVIDQHGLEVIDQHGLELNNPRINSKDSP